MAQRQIPRQVLGDFYVDAHVLGRDEKGQGKCVVTSRVPRRLVNNDFPSERLMQ